MWLKNLSLKITALGLAVLLWFHVATNRTYDYPREVNLTAAPLPAGFALAAPIPNKIHLLFTGTGKELLRFMLEDGSVQLLLEPHMSGTVPVSVDRLISHADASVHISQVVEPTSLDVRVDTVVSRYAHVRFQGEYGTSPEAALTAAPTVAPDKVLLRGPRSVINQLGTIQTEMVDAGTLSSDLTRMTPVDLASAYNVTAKPDSVSVHFAVAPRAHRELSEVPVAVTRGWRTDPTDVTLQLSGAENVLAAVTKSECKASVNPPPDSVSEMLESVEASAPPLVEVESVEPPQVKVTRR